MKIRSRLKHVAAGTVKSIVGRNNDVNGYWAPGLLFRDAIAASTLTVELNLLLESARPASACADIVVARYAIYVRKALQKHGFAWSDMAVAMVTFQFMPASSTVHTADGRQDDHVVCTIALQTVVGAGEHAAACVFCQPWRPGAFTKSGRA